MKKNTLLMLIMMCFGFAGYSQSNASANYLAIENQSGIQVSYVYDNADKPTCFFVKITNNSSTVQSVDYSILNKDAEEVYKAYAPLKLKAGESFFANDFTLAIPIKEGQNLSDFQTVLTLNETK